MTAQSTLPLAGSPHSAGQHYSSEAVEAILSHALELQSAEVYSLDQLQAMAAELNIAPETLTIAEEYWRRRQTETARNAQTLARKQHERRQQWLQYAAGSLLMVGIDIATAGTVTWSIFPVLGWGLGVFLGVCERSHTGSTTVPKTVSESI